MAGNRQSNLEEVNKTRINIAWKAWICLPTTQFKSSKIQLDGTQSRQVLLTIGVGLPSQFGFQMQLNLQFVVWVMIVQKLYFIKQTFGLNPLTNSMQFVNREIQKDYFMRSRENTLKPQMKVRLNDELHLCNLLFPIFRKIFSQKYSYKCSGRPWSHKLHNNVL